MERKTVIIVFLGLVTAGALIWGGHEYRQVQAKTTEISQVKYQGNEFSRVSAMPQEPSI